MIFRHLLIQTCTHLLFLFGIVYQDEYLLFIFGLICFFYNYYLHKSLKKEVKPRKTIPKKIREQVWKNVYGSQLEGKCQICLLSTISSFNFHVGHILAREQGGQDALDNYYPVCSTCNQSMGMEHLLEYKKRLHSYF